MGRIGERRGGGGKPKKREGAGEERIGIFRLPPTPLVTLLIFDRQTDRHVYLESCTINSISTTISKYIKITNNKLLIN